MARWNVQAARRARRATGYRINLGAEERELVRAAARRAAGAARRAERQPRAAADLPRRLPPRRARRAGRRVPAADARGARRQPAQRDPRRRTRRSTRSRRSTRAQVLALMQSLNGLRLVIGTVLDVSEEDDLVGRRRRRPAERRRAPPVRLPQLAARMDRPRTRPVVRGRLRRGRLHQPGNMKHPAVPGPVCAPTDGPTRYCTTSIDANGCPVESLPRVPSPAARRPCRRSPTATRSRSPHPIGVRRHRRPPRRRSCATRAIAWTWPSRSVRTGMPSPAATSRGRTAARSDEIERADDEDVADRRCQRLGADRRLVERRTRVRSPRRRPRRSNSRRSSRCRCRRVGSGTEASCAASRAALSVPDTADEMWIDRISVHPRPISSS